MIPKYLPVHLTVKRGHLMILNVEIVDGAKNVGFLAMLRHEIIDRINNKRLKT